MEHETDDLDGRVARRAEGLPEEHRVGSSDPVAQAEVILDDSDQRTFDRDAAPDSIVEHRTSADTTPPA